VAGTGDDRGQARDGDQPFPFLPAIESRTKLMIILQNGLVDGREATLEALLIKTTEASTTSAQEQPSTTTGVCLLLSLPQLMH